MSEPLTPPSSGPNLNAPAGLNATLAAQIAEKIKANSLNGETDDLTSFETKKKVDNVKQKVYVVALAVIAYLLYTYLDTSLTTYNQSQEKIAEAQTKIQGIENEITSLKSQAVVLKQITRDSDINNLVTCINNTNLCDRVLTGVKNNLNVARAYLLLTPLTGTKMEIDQKSLLKYFNEYLLVGQGGLPLGQLRNITFSQPTLIEQDKKIYKISVDTSISFPSKDAMMQMIEKIETGLDPKHLLLIKINTINYDIVKFEEPQTVDISYTIYQYKK